jgi:hypothetical protein
MRRIGLAVVVALIVIEIGSFGIQTLPGSEARKDETKHGETAP